MTLHPPLCSCGAPATNQALYRRENGSHFLGQAVCDQHRYPLGKPQHARSVEIIDHMDVAP